MSKLEVVIQGDLDGGCSPLLAGIEIRIDLVTVFSAGAFQNGFTGVDSVIISGFNFQILSPFSYTNGQVIFLNASTSNENTSFQTFESRCIVGGSRFLDAVLSGEPLPFNTTVSPRWAPPYNRAEIWITGNSSTGFAGLSQFTLEIRDRMGYLVFEFSGEVSPPPAIRVVEWNLTYPSGVEVPSGTYFIITKFEGFDFGDLTVRGPKRIQVVR